MIFHENCLLADHSHEILYLIFRKSERCCKFAVCCSHDQRFKVKGKQNNRVLLQELFQYTVSPCHSRHGYYKMMLGNNRNHLLSILCYRCSFSRRVPSSHKWPKIKRTSTNPVSIINKVDQCQPAIRMVFHWRAKSSPSLFVGYEKIAEDSDFGWRFGSEILPKITAFWTFLHLGILIHDQSGARW